MVEKLHTIHYICVWNYANLPDPIKSWMEKEHIARDDLDWIALVPPCYSDVWINWLEEPVFGCCSVKTYDFGKDHNLVFGYHA
ncbi:MAG: hypothetical protein WCX79_00730 [Candidatus Paceibacterota bacterium]|jgi:hypothetical protein